MRQKVRIYLDKTTHTRLVSLSEATGVPISSIYLSAWRLGQIVLIFKLSLGDISVNCPIPESYENIAINIPEYWLLTIKNVAKILDLEVSELNRFCINTGSSIGEIINNLEEKLNASKSTTK